MVSKGFITPTRDGIRLNLRVSPGAKRTSIAGTYGEGRANAEVEPFLASLLGIPRSDVLVTRGASSRDKVVVVRGLVQTHTRQLLSSHLR